MDEEDAAQILQSIVENEIINEEGNEHDFEDTDVDEMHGVSQNDILHFTSNDNAPKMFDKGHLRLI